MINMAPKWMILLFLLIPYSSAVEIQTDTPGFSITNPYVSHTESTDTPGFSITNPYISHTDSTGTPGFTLTTEGIDYPIFYSLTLSPDPVNMLHETLLISANLTTAYSDDISSVTANITGCGTGFLSLTKQSGTCSDSCIYTSSFTPTQEGLCSVSVNATDLQGSSGYKQASATAICTSYTFMSMTDQSGITQVNITSMSDNPSTLLISAGSFTKTYSLETSASSLYVNVLVKLGGTPARNKQVTVEVI